MRWGEKKKSAEKMSEVSELFNLKPREDEFFKLFAKSAGVVREGAAYCEEVVLQYEKIEDIKMKMSELEHQADDVNDAILDKLNQTFITPIDREDIYALASKLDDVMDMMDGTVEKMHLYHTGKPTDGAVALASLNLKCADELLRAIELMSNIKKNQEGIMEHIRRIVVIESESDSIYRKEVGELFKTCTDPIYLIKWKEVLQHLEDTADKFEEVADLMRGVVMKYA